jgi:hypothetical protein
MNKHNICPCVVSSMLSITARAWAQTPIDFTPLDNTDQVPLARPHVSVKLVTEASARPHAESGFFQGREASIFFRSNPSTSNLLSKAW